MHITNMSCLIVHTPSSSDHSKHFKLAKPKDIDELKRTQATVIKQ